MPNKECSKGEKIVAEALRKNLDRPPNRPVIFLGWFVCGAIVLIVGGLFWKLMEKATQ